MDAQRKLQSHMAGKRSERNLKKKKKKAGSWGKENASEGKNG